MTVQSKQFAFAISLAFAWAGVAAFGAGPAQAAASAKPKNTGKAEMKSMSDTDFAKAAAEGGLAEVKFGQLAQDKAANKSVKDLGQQMVDDHTKADDDLKTAAAKDNISIPTQIDQKDQSAYDKLAKLSGPAFDRAYARDMVRDHKADVALFRHEADEGKDPAIKSFAAKTLPTLESHLKEAEQTLNAVAVKSNPKETNKQKSKS
jgi:putative membrane protein